MCALLPLPHSNFVVMHSAWSGRHGAHFEGRTDAYCLEWLPWCQLRLLL